MHTKNHHSTTGSNLLWIRIEFDWQSRLLLWAKFNCQLLLSKKRETVNTVNSISFTLEIYFTPLCVHERCLERAGVLNFWRVYIITTGSVWHVALFWRIIESHGRKRIYKKERELKQLSCQFDVSSCHESFKGEKLLKVFLNTLRG